MDYHNYIVFTQGPEVRNQKDKRSLYGIRLFQYSPESEGNIFITNEEL